MKDFGAIIAIGIVAMLLIYFATQVGLPPHVEKGVILTCVSILLFLVAGAIFQYSWQVGIVVGVIAIVLLVFAVNSFGASDTPKPTGLLPIIGHTLPL